MLIGSALRLDTGRNVIQVSDLPPDLRPRENDERPDPVQGDLDSMERTMIERCIKENGGDLNAAAEQLGISRRTMSRKIRTYQLSSPKYTLGTLSAEAEPLL